ncbi:hypothetical protein [Sulfitobacter sp. NAS-14.1]|uniref:hypothetical protein n=1 Tax=Sulfitobacter TaxID=60136 RepID=UPI000066B262|nr:hypothetical protein [Sulfitobacter sp. NAS-14.1]EAP80271.1 hypothetical protein NAS141_17199 [Sulfitobacter sp. NAS-14.1]
MITKTNLPSSYTPYQKLVFCSNVLEGGGNLIEVSGTIPILVGRGDPPLVWLSAKQDAKIVTVVEASRAKFSSVTAASIFGGTVVMSKGVVLLSARQISEEEAEVTEIDLRPLGLNVYGNKSGLHVGGMEFTGNHFSGVGTMVGIG